MIQTAARTWRFTGFALLAAALAAGCDNSPLSLTQQLPAAPDQTVSADGVCAEPANQSALLRDLVEAINTERMKAGIPPLKADPSLMLLADFYACRLIDGDFFDHVDPFDGTSADERALDFGYPFAKIGENLAAGQQTVKAAVADWMSSPKHRRNMLDPAFSDIGVAAKDGGAFGRYWVQELGRPLPMNADPRSTSTHQVTETAQTQPAQ